jgi:hypothetical protein
MKLLMDSGTQARFDAALAAGKSEGLIALVRQFEAEGLKQVEIYHLFHQFMLHLRKQNCVEDENAVAETLDFIAGWCSPQAKLFPTFLCNDEIELYQKSMQDHPNLKQNNTSEEVLTGGGRTLVTRQEEIVFREAKPWTKTIHHLLKHLEDAGFNEAPRIAGSGFDEQGRETLTFIEGEFVHPGPWSDEGLVQVGHLLRRLHDTTASFVPPVDAVWQPWFLREIGENKSVIGHGDLAPWNTLTHEAMPIALIDWEYAGPMDPLTELARVCWLFPQLHDDDVAKRVGLPPAETRLRQLRLLVDAYGLSKAQRRGFFDRILEVAVCETAEDAIEANVTPGSNGLLWGLAWRARAAAWMLRHRAAIENALA